MIDDQFKRIFSNNLKKYMELHGKSQIDLINDLGFNKSAVSTWCNGTRLPRMDKVDALARYFNINRADLIEDKSEYLQSSTAAQPTAGFPTLRPDETVLLALYNQLNEEGMEKATDYLDDLVSSNKYKTYASMDASEVEDPIVLKYDPSLQKLVNDHLKWRKEYLATHKDCVPTKDKTV